MFDQIQYSITIVSGMFELSDDSLGAWICLFHLTDLFIALGGITLIDAHGVYSEGVGRLCA